MVPPSRCRPVWSSPWIALCLGALFLAGGTIRAEDGLFAVFQTNRGTFTARLDHDKAPVTVANFVGLVEGTRGWIDLPTGTLRRQPFYNGITFHRVVPGFVIQAGSPNGLGTDGPGYTFGDEFSPTLLHSGEGILSMANSGPNSNGSQFFITLAPTSWLNRKHSVFGQVVDGIEVVRAIGAVATPVQAPEVVTTIQSITINRVGPAAQAFDAQAPRGLPEWTDGKPELVATPGGFGLRFARSPFSQYFVSRSDDLTAWVFRSSLSDLANAPTQDVDVSDAVTGKSRQFFRVVKAGYPPQPATLVGQTLTLQFVSSAETVTYSFTGPPRGSIGYSPDLGSATYNGGTPGRIGAYLTTPSLNSQQLIVASETVPTLTIALKFQTATSGWFTAQFYGATDGLWPFFGTFQITPTP